MSIEKKLLGTTPVSGAVDPEGVSFDGTNDYLSRSSDLTGNADGKTFTFSAWVYGTGGGTIYHSGGAGFTDGISIHFEASGELNIKMDNPSGSTVFSVEHGGAMPLNTWNHLLISCDMSSTSNRHIYVSDAALGNSYLTYTNSDIDFTSTDHSVNKLNKIKGRLAHVFLDYTYRDLSTESNRRLFIDADGKPSSTIPSSPILYLPMTDAATAGSNSGTGGDFTVNGVLDTAGRAPNQDNCSASVFDGSNDYLSGSPSGMVDGGIFSGSVVVNPRVFSFQGHVIKSTSERWGLRFYGSTSCEITGYTSGAVKILDCQVDNIVAGRILHISFSFDLSDTGKRHLFVNGVDASPAYSVYTAGNIDFTNNPVGVGARPTAVEFLEGDIGELYFDTSYIDLATDNPFWDADANRPKPVRQVISETGTTPLIALPLQGNDAGNNLGSGGDFTVNSGPYTGARGGSEFWARSADFNGSNGYLSRSSALTGSSDGKQVTLVFAFSGTSNKYIIDLEDATGTTSTTRFGVWAHYTNNKIFVDAYNGSETRILDFDFGTTLNTNQTYIVMISIDMSNTSKRHTYIDGASESATYTTYTNDTLKLTQTNTGIGARLDASLPGSYWNGDIGFMYFNNSYIDFSQESNRNLFVDQLGYPKDLTPAIEAATIADPLIYMKFDDTSALGTNSGTGGNFTVNGTVTAGADVDPNA